MGIVRRAAWSHPSPECGEEGVDPPTSARPGVQRLLRSPPSSAGPAANSLSLSPPPSKERDGRSHQADERHDDRSAPGPPFPPHFGSRELIHVWSRLLRRKSYLPPSDALLLMWVPTLRHTSASGEAELRATHRSFKHSEVVTGERRALQSAIVPRKKLTSRV